MIRYFRINDPLRIVGVLLVLLALRLPLLIGGLPLTLPELEWLLAGQAMQGGSNLYDDVWGSVGPISAGIYYVFGLIWPQNPDPLRYAAILVLVVQAFYFNQIMVKYNVYKENTFVPGLCYVLLGHFTFDFVALSPPLIALSFLLPVLVNVVRIGERQREDRIILTGTYLGLAVLCYLPSVVFLLMTLFTYALYKSSSARRLMLLVFSFGLVHAMHFAYLLFFSDPLQYLEMYWLSPFSAEPNRLMSLSAMGWLLLVPTVLLVWAVLRVLAERGFVNYQSTIQRIMLLWIISAAIAIVTLADRAPYHLLLFLPATTFFTAHYLLLIRRKIVTELTFWFLVIFLAGFTYGSYHWSDRLAGIINFDGLIVKSLATELPTGKRVLVLGSEPSYYLANEPVPSYLDWQIAQKYFKQLDKPWVVLEIYQTLSKDWPDVMYDPSDILPELFYRLPDMERRYAPILGKEGWFQYVPPVEE